MKRRTLIGTAALAACTKTEADMNELAGRYVRLILDIGEHEPKYVDAYYGPAEWKPKGKTPLAELGARASALITELGQTKAADPGRFAFLVAQTRSALAYIDFLKGERLDFDREAKALYAVEPPKVLPSEMEAARAAIDAMVPGRGSLADRLAAFEERFAIPANRVDRVFRAAIAEARARTKKWIHTLAVDESFDIEYVKGKVWSAYNWYKGGSKSLIQVNIDLPIGIDRIIHLACHEGYPGHHVYNGLLEAKLVRERGWMEFSVYPLYSPQSLIAEGTADYGVSLVLPDAERLAFKRDVLFQEAGLNPKAATEQHAVSAALRAVKHAAIQAARLYLDGRMTAPETVEFLQRFALQSKGMAERRVKFIDSERTYIINYSFGEDLVVNWMNRTAGAGEAGRWKAFTQLLSTPSTPASLL
ncbi:MAG: hypothetical protein FJW30_09380 [Acidobacteria bacterium]|nr:hypothetical protein [Acidobacteriota bacterium]